MMIRLARRLASLRDSAITRLGLQFAAGWPTTLRPSGRAR